MLEICHLDQPGPDPRPGAYYVSVIDKPRSAIDKRSFDVLAGPWRTHQPALDYVAPARRLTIALRPLAAFYGYGTCRITGDGPLPVGKLNDRLGLALDADGYVTEGDDSAAIDTEVAVPLAKDHARHEQPTRHAGEAPATDRQRRDRCQAEPTTSTRLAAQTQHGGGP